MNNPAAMPANDAASNSDSNIIDDTSGVSGKRLQTFFDRIERLEEEKAGLAEDIKDIYAEAKAVGFDVKTMRRVMKLKKMDAQKRQEEDELLELYLAAIGLE